MAHKTKIHYNAKGFWIHEDFVELLCLYICETFESIGVNSFNSVLKDIYADCDANRGGSNTGMVTMLLDDSIQNTSDKSTLINILQQTKTRVQNLGNEVSISQLNQFENNKVDNYFKYTWSIPVKTQSLIATIDIIIDMLNGTYPYDNASIHYVGFPGGTSATTFV